VLGVLRRERVFVCVQTKKLMPAAALINREFLAAFRTPLYARAACTTRAAQHSHQKKLGVCCGQQFNFSTAAAPSLLITARVHLD
jgi:hypothetical protein